MSVSVRTEPRSGVVSSTNKVSQKLHECDRSVFSPPSLKLRRTQYPERTEVVTSKIIVCGLNSPRGIDK